MLIINKIKDYPIIYLRYLNNKLMYVGESCSFVKSRHARENEKDGGDYDLIKILKAPKDIKRRRYWEALLICKLKPILQNIENYKGTVERTNKRPFSKSYYKSISNKNDYNDYKKNLLYPAEFNLSKFNELMKKY